jgi:peptidoglycan/LPS O-acetylase OafA/YrhL
MTVASLETSPVHRIHSLDGLRGWLALYVCVYHFLNSVPPTHALLGGITHAFQQGSFAVDVFFVISGFIMSYVYTKNFKSSIALKDYGRFMQARIARLVPVNLVTLGILFVVLVPFLYTTDKFLSPDGRYSWHSALATVFLGQGVWVDHRTWNYPSWSISTEFYSYLVFPFLVPLFARGRAAALGFGALGLAIALIIYSKSTGDGPPTNGLLAFIRTLALFVVGMTVNTVYKNEAVQRLASAPLVAVGLGVVLALLIHLVEENFMNVVAVVLVPVIVLITLHQPVVRDFFSRPLGQTLGRLSYSLYMVHAVVQIIILDRVVGVATKMGYTHPLIGVLLVTIGIGITWIAALLLHRFVEVPARTFLHPRRS